MSSNPNSRRLVQKHKQAVLDYWFGLYNLKFGDPTHFATFLTNRFRQINELERTGQLTEELRSKAGCNTLYEILEEIRDLPDHRHREDAANILAEVDERLDGRPPLPLVSRPMNVPPSPRTQAEMDMDNIIRSPFDDDFIKLKMPPFRPEDGLPIPWVRVRESKLPPPKLGKTNLGVVDQLATKYSQNIAAKNSILDILLAGTNLRGLDPPTYLDNPAEVVLEMPDNLRFLDDPIEDVDDDLLDQAQWPKLDIFDLRRGSAAVYGPLQENDYIYQLISLTRQILSQPEIARKYTIVHRAYPSRYQDGTPEEFVDEDAPTVEEG